MSEYDDKELDDLGWRLRQDRPVPSGAFRAQLRSDLAASLGRSGSTVRAGRRLVLAYLVAGCAALLIAATGLLANGPLAAPEPTTPAAKAPAPLVASADSATGSAARSPR